MRKGQREIVGCLPAHWALAVGIWLIAASALAGDFTITRLDQQGGLTWSNVYPFGICTVESSPVPGGPWTPLTSQFTSNALGQTTVARSTGDTYYRLLSVDISTNASRHYTNLLESYGLLETLAGKGQYKDDKRNNWLPGYEGGPATNANLSRPHMACVDRGGNILLVDEGSSSVLKITPQGTIHTLAGTHVNGFNGDGPAPATNLHLHYPNGGWLRDDGTFYVLDTYNGKVRRIDTNGLMTTLFTTTAPINEGRALWVKSDESVVYFGTGTRLRKWTQSQGVVALPNQFLDLGNILGDENTGDLYLTDRDAYRVYRLSPAGLLTVLAGNGTRTGGGDGFPALQTGLDRPRTLCFLPNGGYFIGEHDGSRVWYVDPAAIIHLWLDGRSGNYHAGDGEWFHTPGYKVSKVRSVTLDYLGNLVIVENDYGYVRRINFHRLTP